MPLQLAVADGGNVGVALRRHRGAHNLLGTGQCRRLAKLVPNLAADNGTAALLNHSFVEWLAAPIIFPDDAVRARPLFTTMPSVEQYGKSLERALSKLKGDQPRAPAVLRAQLRRIALADRAAGNVAATDYTLADADVYQVAEGAFPTGPDVDDKYDWLGVLTVGQLVPADGSLVVYADLARLISPRFDHAEALKVGGVFDVFAKTVQKAVSRDEIDLLGRAR